MLKFAAVRPDMPPPALWRDLIDQTYAGGRFTNYGPLNTQFEGEIRRRYGGAGEVCVSANNATSGLAACLIAKNVVGRVVVPGFTFAASLGAIRMAGADPLVVDVSLSDWTIAPQALVEVLATHDVGAIMLVAPFGLKRDFAEHVAIAEHARVPVVIDNAAGLGIHRKPVASSNVFEVFSLHATKPWSIGEGGMIFAEAGDEQALRSAMNFALAHDGNTPPYWGMNGKLSEFHAAAGLAQAARIDEVLERRRQFVSRYLNLLKNIEGLRYPSDVESAPWQIFPILMPSERHVEAMLAFCAGRGMELRRYYRPSLSTWPQTNSAHPCPNAEALAARMCCFPVYSNCSEEEHAEMFAIVEEAFAEVCTVRMEA